MKSGEVESLMAGTLVIGYGNTLRRDDAAGVRVAEAVKTRGLIGVRVLATHQLMPELAEEVAGADRVIFVDARADNLGAGVDVRRIDGPAGDDSEGSRLTHAVSPELILHMARMLYGRRPEAWVVSIPAPDLGVGEELSETARVGIAIAIDRVVELA